MVYLLIVFGSLLYSSVMFIFWIAKGGFNRKFLYTDNLLIGLATSMVSLVIYHLFLNHPLIILFLISPFVVFVLFVLLFLFRFFRNPKRKITNNPDEFVSPADGRIIYIKELEENQLPVSIKRRRVAKIEEITKTEILKQPCYLIGIAMTLFDVHVNRAPIEGVVKLVKHTPGDYLGLNKPDSIIVNERNTIVIQREDGVIAGVIQIAARFVRRCIVSVSEGEKVAHGSPIGKIRWGSQADLIIPRTVEILVREGDQVYAGSSIIARLENPQSYK